MSNKKVSIFVSNLGKTYKRPVKRTGRFALFSDLFKPKIGKVYALKNVSFEVYEGEIVGFIGPNGAGKSTTLKLLAGVLHPDEGEVRVLGYNPYKKSDKFLRKISFFAGYRGFLQETTWDLSVLDGLQYMSDIYGISKEEFNIKVDLFANQLKMIDFLNTPLRQLSSGQRIRAELAAALLWNPKVLLLDEPTIGLDLMTQYAIWDFIKDYTQKCNATTILTSHYLRDIEVLANRIILIDEGQIVFDGLPKDLIDRISPKSVINVLFDKVVNLEKLEQFGFSSFTQTSAVLQTETSQVNKTTKEIFENFPVSEISFEEPNLETVMKEYFSK